MEPIFVGLFQDSLEAIQHAKNHGPTGLYLAEFTTDKFSESGHHVYFWLNDSIPYFAIYIFPLRSLKVVALNAAFLDSNIPYKEGQLLYAERDEFCNQTINIGHPATEWLLFNQDLWNPST